MPKSFNQRPQDASLAPYPSAVLGKTRLHLNRNRVPEPEEVTALSAAWRATHPIVAIEAERVPPEARRVRPKEGNWAAVFEVAYLAAETPKTKH